MSTLNVRQVDDVDGHTEGRRFINHQATTQLTSLSLGLNPVSGAAGDISDMFAGVMKGLEELRQDMTKSID